MTISFERSRLHGATGAVWQTRHARFGDERVAKVTEV
jgi:hypothetical protein